MVVKTGRVARPSCDYYHIISALSRQILLIDDRDGYFDVGPNKSEGLVSEYGPRDHVIPGKAVLNVKLTVVPSGHFMYRLANSLCIMSPH